MGSTDSGWFADKLDLFAYQIFTTGISFLFFCAVNFCPLCKTMPSGAL